MKIRKMKNLLILIVTLSFLLGCSKSDDNVSYDCKILQTLEEVNELIDKCDENLIESKSEIEDELKGEWILSGIKSGVGAIFEPISTCFLLSISDNSLLLINQDTDEIFTSTWELEFYEVNNIKVFFLNPDDEALRYKVGMQFFSKNIIYGAGNADDTNIYVYEKVI